MSGIGDSTMRISCSSTQPTGQRASNRPPCCAKTFHDFLFMTYRRTYILILVCLLSISIFSADAYEPGKLLDISPQDFERRWRIGCFGRFFIRQTAARLMLPLGSGTIIFTGASASLSGSVGFVNLTVSKCGLRAPALSMARELGPKGIHVAHVITDGQTESKRYREQFAKRGPDSLLSPNAIAETYHDLHRQHRSAGRWICVPELRRGVFTGSNRGLRGRSAERESRLANVAIG